MKLNAVALLGLLLLSASLSRVTAQSQEEKANSTMHDYKAGQVWTMGGDITVTILAIEDVHKVGRVVHVRVDKIPSLTMSASVKRFSNTLPSALVEERHFALVDWFALSNLGSL